VAKGTVFKHVWKQGGRVSWKIKYRLPDGRWKVETVGPNKKLAERVLAERVTAVNQGRFEDLREATFREFADKWLQDYARPHLKPSTYDGYERYLNGHWIPAFGDLPLRSLTPGRIQETVNALAVRGLKAKSVNNFVVPLKKMLGDAVKWGYLQHNPAINVARLPVRHEEMRALNPTEVTRLLDAVADEHRLFFELAVFTGLRRGELIGLRWKDVDWLQRRLRVQRSVWNGQIGTPKSARSVRAVDLTPALLEHLRDARPAGPDDQVGERLMFPGEDGGLRDPVSFLRWHFKPALKRAGLPDIRFHDLRHTYASLLILAGEHPKFVQTQLGHASITTTLDRYGHLLPGAYSHAGERLQNLFRQDEGDGGEGG
jgi:integrase